MITPTHPYWPLTPGSTIDFAVFDITGTFHPTSLHLDVTSRTLRTDIPYQSVTIIKIPSGRPTIADVQYPTASPAPTLETVEMYGQLTEGLWKPPTGHSWIGEDIVQCPPLPKLTFDITPGLRMSGVSKAANYTPTGETGGVGDVPWEYAVLSAGPWGTWPDTVRTALFESGNIYNYVFARGVGMVDFWYSYGGVTGTVVNGIQMYGIGHRGQ